ncbi:MAG TPA: FAD-binding oxidoreductase [Anaeromyxobacteraceae bacterium]|nr:FAD-binding oxidoreductase [Anaeromyxobacteraceae bacterium]
MVTGAREGGPEDAVLGVVPRHVVEPATVEEAVEVVRACARDRLCLAFLGGGTDLELGAPPRQLDVLLCTKKLGRVVEHAPSDQVVVVEAGLPLAELQRHLARERQRLALDPPCPQRATLGGIVAANAFGPLRHRYGSARDLVIGMSFVRADGAAAKGGSKVVKNVAGFDIPRLLVGSLGTLGLITSVTFRLHPLPEAEAMVRVAGLAPESLFELYKALRSERLEPVSVVALLDGRGLELCVRLEGFAAGLAGERARLLAVLEQAGHAGEVASDDEARAFRARHDALREEGALRLKVTAPPASLPKLLDAVLVPLLDRLRGGAAAIYPALGVAFLGGHPEGAVEVVGAVKEARAALLAQRGSLVLCSAPPALRSGLDPWGTPPAAIRVMREVKDRLDPEHRLAPGRFVGGI